MWPLSVYKDTGTAHFIHKKQQDGVNQELEAGEGIERSKKKRPDSQEPGRVGSIDHINRKGYSAGRM